MGAPSSLAMALLSLSAAAPAVEVRPGVGAEGWTRTFAVPDTETVTRIDLGLAAQLGLAVRASTSALTAAYGASLRTEGLAPDARLRLLHRASVRGELQAGRRWRLDGNAAGQYGETYVLTEAPSDPEGAAPALRSERAIRHLSVGGGVGTEAALSAASSFAARLGAEVNGGATPEARALLPLVQTIQADLRLGWVSSRSDRWSARASASQTTIDPGGTGEAASLTLGWDHSTDGPLGGWAAAGLAAARSDPPGLAEGARLFPQGEVGLRHASAPLSVASRVVLRIAPALDRFGGGYGERLEALASSRWRLLPRLALTGTAASSAMPWRESGVLLVGRLEARVEWALSRRSSLTAAVIGQRQRDDARVMPTASELSTFVSVAFDAAPSREEEAR